jgi:hypothetical protein
MSQCTANAIEAADRAVDLIIRRLQDDLASLDEQLSEINYMIGYEEITDANRQALKQLRHKILALNPTRPEILLPPTELKQL